MTDTKEAEWQTEFIDRIIYDDFVKKFSVISMDGENPRPIIGRFIEGKKVGEDWVGKITTKEMIAWLRTNITRATAKAREEAYDQGAADAIREIVDVNSFNEGTEEERKRIIAVIEQHRGYASKWEVDCLTNLINHISKGI
jgi:hypothetical protein